jgi:hypothetical protein
MPNRCENLQLVVNSHIYWARYHKDWADFLTNIGRAKKSIATYLLIVIPFERWVGSHRFLDDPASADQTVFDFNIGQQERYVHPLGSAELRATNTQIAWSCVSYPAYSTGTNVNGWRKHLFLEQATCFTLHIRT